MENENIFTESENTYINDSESSVSSNETFSGETTPVEAPPDNTETMPSDTIGSGSSLPEPSDSSGDITQELTDRLDALISILTPEELTENGTSEEAAPSEPLSDYSEASDSSLISDSVNQELLNGIYETLALIKSDNVSYHAEMLVNQENICTENQHVSWILENIFVLLLIVGFFVALNVGSRLSDCFFKRMKG